MAVSVRITWRPWEGQQVLEAMRRKGAGALNEAAADGVTFIQMRWPRDTGFSANTMEVTKQATPSSMTAEWGNITADYVVWIEIGARGRPGRYIMAKSLEEMAATLPRRLAS